MLWSDPYHSPYFREGRSFCFHFIDQETALQSQLWFAQDHEPEVQENSEKLESRAFLSQLLLGPPHSNFRPRSTTISSMGGTFKCPQGPTSNQGGCCALGWPADYAGDNANMEGIALSWHETRESWVYPRMALGRAAHWCQSSPLSQVKPETWIFMRNVLILMKLAIGSNLQL